MIVHQNIARFIRTIDSLEQAGCHIPGLILSHPGFSKSTAVKMYCDAMDYNCITLIPSQHAADDILGIQSVVNNNLVRLTPSWFNHLIETMKNGKRTLLFIDEISTCDHFIQGPLLDLIFNGNLGEEHLPSNCFIISAGNYSADLNGEFQMSNPLVNRFMILNLQATDYSINDLFMDNDPFEKLVDAKSIAEFLNLDDSKKNGYDFNNFMKWLKSSREVEFASKCEITETDEGILGFASIRSVNYSLKFAKEYMTHYNDDLWERVIGDTLGCATKRNDNIPYRNILKANDKQFRTVSESKNVDFNKCVADKNCKKKLTIGDINELKKAMISTNPNNIATATWKNFQKLVKANLDSSSDTEFIESLQNLVETATGISY